MQWLSVGVQKRENSFAPVRSTVYDITLLSDANKYSGELSVDSALPASARVQLIGKVATQPAANPLEYEVVNRVRYGILLPKAKEFLDLTNEFTWNELTLNPVFDVVYCAVRNSSVPNKRNFEIMVMEYLKQRKGRGVV